MVLQASSVEGSKSEDMTKKLSREDESFVSELQKTYKVEKKAKIVRALDLLRSLDQSVLDALGQLDVSVIRRSMAGNAEAQRVGERILQRLIEFTRRKTPLSSGKSPVSSGPSRGGAEKRRSDDVSFRGSQPAQKMPRISDRVEPGSGHVGPGFNRLQGPPDSSRVQPLFDRRAEWVGPSGRGGMMRGQYPMSGYRPPPRGRYGRDPYF